MQFCTVEEFVGLNHERLEMDCMDISDKIITRVTDEKAKELIRKIAKCESTSEFQKLDIPKRDRYLKKLKEKGLSLRQLSRLTGVSFSVVRKI